MMGDGMMGDGMMPDIVKTVNDSLETAHSGLVVTAPDIVAKLKNGPLFLKIFAAPGQVADLVEAIEDDEDDDNAAESDDTGSHCQD